MQMLMQTSTELYNHTINVALLTACIVREDEKRGYDPYEVVLGALLHDIGIVRVQTGYFPHCISF